MKESSVYSVLVVSPAGRGADFLASVFDAPTFDPVVNALSAGEARRLLSSEQYDLIAVNSPLPDETGIDFCIDAAQGPSGVMLFVKNDIYEIVSSQCTREGIFVIPKPNTQRNVAQSVTLLCAICERLRKYEKKTRTLREKMDSIRIVNRAKWLLIERLGMTEQDAHGYIEKEAMNRRRTSREIAEEIIRMYEN
ncbi:MAG: ANTAR domain-containing response regulator [Lachnospiraceae bacterium]|jgi:AmiR/NasT family two-component response regulator